MRLPRLRFTVRRLMLVVALAGLVMGGGVWGYRMWRMSAKYARIAQSFKWTESLHRGLEARFQNNAQREAAKFAAVATHYAALVRKYERAARYPWLPVEPDPPER
jgi:hypothetical protein